MATVIFDLDGTLSDASWRDHFRQDGNWDEYFEHCSSDPVVKPVAELLSAVFKAGHRILIITGRPERVRKTTEAWLLKNLIMYDKLYMRKDDDFHSNEEYKNEVLDSITEPILFAVEDDPEAVKVFKERGITCLQVA